MRTVRDRQRPTKLPSYESDEHVPSLDGHLYSLRKEPLHDLTRKASVHARDAMAPDCFGEDVENGREKAPSRWALEHEA